jgi:DNA-binding LytR/AlgR family response regulator
MSDARCTAIIAEDEALLRRELLEQLGRAWPALQVVAECEDGACAVEALAEHRPDVAFLDIRMPGLSGLEVAAAAADTSPHTAIDAFERGAVDYLLKPIQPERLAATVQRLQARTGNNEAAMLSALLERLGQAPPRQQPDARAPLTWITASAGRETRLILVDEVAYFRADNKYTTVVTADGEALLRTRTLSSRSTARPSSTSRRSPAWSATTAAAAPCA